MVEETVVDSTEESDWLETLVDQNDGVDSFSLHILTSFIFDNNTEVRQTPSKINQARKTNNEEVIKKLAFRLDSIKNKKIRFSSHKEFLEKCFHDNLTPNSLKINLEPTRGNQHEAFINKWY